MGVRNAFSSFIENVSQNSNDPLHSTKGEAFTRIDKLSEFQLLKTAELALITGCFYGIRYNNLTVRYVYKSVKEKTVKHVCNNDFLSLYGPLHVIKSLKVRKKSLAIKNHFV